MEEEVHKNKTALQKESTQVAKVRRQQHRALCAWLIECVASILQRSVTLRGSPQRQRLRWASVDCCGNQACSSCRTELLRQAVHCRTGSTTGSAGTCRM